MDTTDDEGILEPDYTRDPKEMTFYDDDEKREYTKKRNRILRLQKKREASQKYRDELKRKGLKHVRGYAPSGWIIDVSQPLIPIQTGEAEWDSDLEDMELFKPTPQPQWKLGYYKEYALEGGAKANKFKTLNEALMVAEQNPEKVYGITKEYDLVKKEIFYSTRKGDTLIQPSRDVLKGIVREHLRAQGLLEEGEVKDEKWYRRQPQSIKTFKGFHIQRPFGDSSDEESDIESELFDTSDLEAQVVYRPSAYRVEVETIKKPKPAPPKKKRGRPKHTRPRNLVSDYAILQSMK